MNIRVERSTIIRKFIAFLLIVAFTMADFLLLGIEVVSYAAEERSSGTITNNKNVTFDVYFKQEDGTIITSKKESILNDNIGMFVQINVSNDGYFNGTISLEDANFKIKDKVLSNCINKIENNTITLNQINGGDAVEFEVMINPIKEDIISSNFINMMSKVSINGIYKNSTEKDININATREIQLILENPYKDDEGTEIKSEIITNKIYEIDGEEKRVVQVLVESGIEGNKYPIKENNIEISVPDGVEKIGVISRGKFASNGKTEADFNSNDWTYVENDKKINVQIKNLEENNLIKWEKRGNDKIVVTYIVDSNLNIEGKQINAKSSIRLYDINSTLKEASTTVTVSGEKDGVITNEMILEESSIYKGKIYSEENRDYKVKTNIYINKVIKDKTANVELLPSTYEINEGEMNSNIQLKSTIINKAEMIRILGENGYIKIITKNGSETQINKDTENDESGNIIINYPEGIKEVAIETSVPEKEGTIELNTTKTIKQDGTSREVKRKYKSIKEKITNSEAKIELKETESKVSLDVNKTKWSTLAKNEDIQITATLLTNNEKYDLFKNPSFEIVLPEGISNIEVKTTEKLYADMFNVKEAIIKEDKGTKILRIALDGEQTKYTNSTNQTEILITLNVEFDKLTPSSDTKVALFYTNENGIQETYNVEKAINVESKYGLMMYTTMSGFNTNGESLSTMDDEIAKGNLELDSTEKVATVKGIVINNYEETMQNVNIIGRIPSEGMSDGTINTQLKENIKTSIENAKILYSTNANAEAKDNTWQESIEGAKAYKITVDNLQKGEEIETEYSFIIPENLECGQRLYAKINTEYTYLGNEMIQTSTLGAETPKINESNISALKEVTTENLGNGLIAKVGTTSAGKELKNGDDIYEGQTIKYIVQITNNGQSNLKNAKASIEQENGNIYDLKDYQVYNSPYYGDEELHTEHVYEELNTNKKEFNLGDNFEVGKTVQFIYEIVANQVEGDAQTKGKITINADDFEELNFNTISNNIKQADLKLNYKYYRYEEEKLYFGRKIETQLSIENIATQELHNAEVKVTLPEGTYGADDLYDCSILEGDYEFQDERVNNVKYNKEDNTITFNITGIKPGSDEKILIGLFVEVDKFEEEEKEFSFIAEASINNKTYYSNIFNKEIYNVVDDVTIEQTANIEDNKLLKSGDEFTITIVAKNNSNTDLYGEITDDIPACFTVTSAVLEAEGKKEELQIKEYNEENIEENDNIIMYSETSGAIVNLTRKFDAKKEIKLVLNIKTNINTGELEVNNTATIGYGTKLNENYYNYLKTKESSKTYKIEPLEIGENINYIEVTQGSNIQNKSTIKDGQKIVYVTHIKNISNEDIEISILDELPGGIELKQVILDNKDITETYANNNELSIEDYEISNDKDVLLQIITEYNQDKAASRELSNKVEITTPEYTVTTNAITYYAEQQTDDEEQNGNGNNNSDNNNSSEGENSGNSQNENEEPNEDITYTIRGTAWLDENKNGRRESDERLMSGITAKVIDSDLGSFVQDNGQDLVAITDDSGEYSFNIQRGNYIVVFMYDSTNYGVTQYQSEGIEESRNSDAISKRLQINGETYTVAATDIIKLIYDDVENIDMGLTENTQFDLEFNKYVSEITVITSKERKTYNYDNSNLAKVEIHAKQISGANVIIKYNMKIKNTGEIPGYVKDIADYIPNGLTFSSELNNDWYINNNILHYNNLANTRIDAGEEKEITLILTKKMTENNTGLVSNVAELADVSNQLGVDDVDSTSGNRSQNEDDIGRADVIISVKTGALIMYTGLVIALLILMGLGAYFINKKILNNYDEFEDFNF